MPQPTRPALRVERHDALSPTSRAAVVALLDAATGAAGFPPVSEQALLDVGLDPAGTTDRHAVALLAWRGVPDRLVGFGALDLAASEASLELAFDPSVSAPGESGGSPPIGGSITGALLDEALRTARNVGADRIVVWLREPRPDDEAVVVAKGLSPVRDLLQLRVALPLPPAVHRPGDEIDLRAFRPGRDELAWLEVNARAFAAHPEQGRWTLEDLDEREQEPWFDPDGFLLHDGDDGIAAFCWTKVHPDAEPPQGEIYVIAVAPGHQGSGLGHAMTVAGLDHLAARGLRVGMLYVEGDNEAALGLYRSLGFSVHHTERAYSAPLEPS